MDLIERYVQEVGRRLPRKQRVDVQDELRSLLQDMVEDQAQTKVENADEEVIVHVLREFGNPKEVAASYEPEKQYLIGPQLFPIFKVVVAIVTAVIGSLVLFGITLSVRSSEAFLQDWLTMIIRGIPDFIDSLFSSLTIVVIIFAILERTLPAEAFEDANYDEDDEAWDPRKLPEPSQNKQLSRGELIVGIVVAIFVLNLINFYPQHTGIFYFEEGSPMVLIGLSENFYTNILPWINLLLIVSIIVDLFKLYTGKLTRFVQILDLGTTLLTAVVVYILMTSGPIFGAAIETVPVLADTFNMLLGLGLPILFVIMLLSAAKKVYDLWKMPKTNNSANNGDSKYKSVIN